MGLSSPLFCGNNQVVDGRNRLECLQELGIEEFEIIEFEGSEDEMLEYVMGLNMTRRQLTSGQKAAVAVELGTYRKKLAAGAKPAETGSGKRVMDELAEELGTNRQYLYDAEKLKEGDPDLFDQVKSGEVRLGAAMATFKKLNDPQDEEKADAPSKDDATDAFGKSVPEQLEVVFSENDHFAYAENLISEARSIIEAIQKRKKASKYLDNSVAADLKSIVKTLKSVKPHALCPVCLCGVTKPMSECDCCNGDGWVSSAVYKVAQVTGEEGDSDVDSDADVPF